MSLRTLCLFVIALTSASAALTAWREEVVTLFENRKATVLVPPGLAYKINKDIAGAAAISLTEPDEKVSVHLTLLPDTEEAFLQARARKEKMVEVFDKYVGDSKEGAMQFEELEPKTGVGTYCTFTDKKLTEQGPKPPGEFVYLTVGVKAWPGVVAIFEVFTQSTTSPEYLGVMKMLRESVEEKPGPLK